MALDAGEFLRRPLFSVDGFTLTIGLAVVVIALVYVLMLRRR